MRYELLPSGPMQRDRWRDTMKTLAKKPYPYQYLRISWPYTQHCVWATYHMEVFWDDRL